MRSNYVLLPDAEADLRGIIRYTCKQWGEAQTRTYIAKLKCCIESMADGDARSKDMSALYPRLRMMRCEHHHVFGLPRDNDGMAVVAIFHERMELMVRLADRLK